VLETGLGESRTANIIPVEGVVGLLFIGKEIFRESAIL
jgi:hypothetical protein